VELEELEKIWKDQKEFNKNFIDYENMIEKEKVEQLKEYSLMLIDEVMELVRETNWKAHRKDNRYMINSNVKEELIDIFKYWLSIGLIWDLDVESFIEEYHRKSSVVEQRFKQEKQLNFKSNKIVGVDIDGVLADYPGCFIEYINQKVGTNFKVENLTQYNIYEAIKDIPTNIMKELKHEFRKSGELKNVGVFPGAKVFLNTLRNKDYKIVLLSARPYKKYRRIFADTQEWLSENGLVHDAILWDEDKMDRLIREFGEDNVEFFIEDNLENANSISKTTNVYLINKSYNKGKINENVIRVNSLKEVLVIEEKKS
jgi:uncharacterized HAD superfamily protein